MLLSLVLNVLILLSTWSEHSTDAYPGSIQYESVSLSSLSTLGCRECFALRHSEEQLLSDKILACPGPNLFVGVLSKGSDTFLLGAFGNASEITQVTPNDSPNLSNGVYWYFTPGYSFGFLNSVDLQQTPIDTGTTGFSSRMSWSLSPTDRQEGYRVGSLVLNGSRSVVQKFSRTIFNCPKSEYILPPLQSTQSAGLDVSAGMKADSIAISSSEPDLSTGLHKEVPSHFQPLCCHVIYHLFKCSNTGVDVLIN